MRSLTQADALAGDLPAGVGRILDRHLRRDMDRPIAVGFSGGGDSLALLLMARAWAASAGRPIIALTVDHGLQPQGPDWTAACAATARRLGVAFQALRWEGEKPATGLSAAARTARHRLLAEAARGVGARVILLGHTADDLIEASLMRGEGSTTPDPRAWAPSPAWPQGRDIFLLRPLLDLRRVHLRDGLRDRGESWIDDPANENPASARARARLTAAGLPRARLDLPPSLAPLGDITRMGDGGELLIPRAALRAADAKEAARFLAMACVCAGGGDRLPLKLASQRLAGEVQSRFTSVTATLAGARIEVDREAVLITRETGEAARGGLAAIPLATDTPVVWDGRFELLSRQAGGEIRPLQGLSRRLSAPARRNLNALPAAVRGGLPALVSADGDVACPILEKVSGVAVRSLMLDRLHGACGLVEAEPA